MLPLLSRRHLLLVACLFGAAGRLAIRKLTTRKYTIQNRDDLFLEVGTDGGITGVGEGLDLRTGGDRRAVLMTALAAVNIALWDIAGKRLGEPCGPVSL